MQVALFGATGNLGLILQDRLTSSGYQVRSFIHSKSPDAKPNVTYIRGDALNYADILAVIKGCDAVINALGGDEHTTVRSQAASQIVKAMQDEHLKRLICMGGSGILTVGPWHFEQLPVFPKDKRVVTKDHERVYQILLKSDLDWTQICPSIMTNGHALGRYRIRAGHPFLLWKQSIRLADVADFIIKELKENRYISQQLALIN